MKTLGTLFSGFGGFDMGAHAAGLQSAWGIEYDADIADVARMNGLPVMTANVLDIDPHTLAWVNWLHASPPCPNFSQAKAGRAETTHDLALAAKVAEFAAVMKPDVFSLENVRAYEKSMSFKLIVDALFDAGYWPQWSVENAANYGVPQTRERLILRATRGHMPAPLPEPVRLVGWYEAIEDIIDTLPESKFADWQLARLPKEILTTLVDSAGYPAADGVVVPVMRAMTQPANTIIANFERRPMRAFIVDGQCAFGKDETAQRCDGEPMFTITASQERRPLRAFLVDHQNVTRDATVRDEAEPSFSIVSSAMRRPASTPSAWLNHGRVVQMTPRALARFQSFPDTYQLPANKGLACKGIGNAVPSLLAQRIVEATL